MKRTVLPHASFTLLALAGALGAQEQARDTARTDTVVVTATRLPLTRGALPVAVTVITGDDLREHGILTVAEALRANVPSAYLAQSGSHGATTSLFLRGGESKYVKVLIDGVPVNEPGGTFDFASLTTDNIERIEVVRGQASVVHGPDAATGVVHVITRGGTSGAARAETDIRFGMAGRDSTPGVESPRPMSTLGATVTTRGAYARGDYSLSVGAHRSNGLYAFNNTWRNTVVSSRTSFRPMENTSLRLALRYTDYQYNYPTNGSGQAVDSNAFRFEDRLSAGLELERRFSQAVRAVLALNSSVNEGGTDDAENPGDLFPSSFVSDDRSRRRGGELRVHILPATAVHLTTGVQLEHQDQRSASVSSSTFGDFASDFAASRRNVAGFTELVLSPASAITATVGARLDDNERFGHFWTGRAGLSWHARPGTRLRTTVGNSFREPAFFETFSTSFSTGNPDLRPERVVGGDAGIEQEIADGRGRLGLTIFAQRFRDMIDFDATETACGASYCNVAEATSRGLELEGRASLTRALSLALGATLLRTRVEEPGYDSASGGLFERGQRLLRRPERSWNAELAWRDDRSLLALTVLGVGERDDRFFGTSGAERVTLPAYRRVDVAGEFRLTSGTATTLRVENLFNIHYRSVYDFFTPRRTITLGVRVRS